MNRDEKAALAYLTQTLELSEQIDHDLKRSYLLRALMTSALSGVHRAKELAGELAEVEARIIEDVDALVDLRAEITDRIDRLPNVKLQIILELRYLCHRTWEQVAADLEMSLIHVNRLHKMALGSFQRTAMMEQRLGR